MSFSDRLKEARKKAGYTQQRLAKESGLATGTIQQYELGKRSPRPEALAKIATTLNLGYSYTKDGEPYFYTFVDTAEHDTDNIKFNKEQYLSAREKLLNNYDSVSEEGKGKIVSYSDDIASNPKYKKDPTE